MRTTLTEQQSAVLAFINRYRAENQIPPTRNEIAQHFGWKSPNAAEDALRALERKNFIRLASGTARGIYVYPTAPA